MRKYKVDREQPMKLPSKEVIEKYKNFAQLAHDYGNYVKRPKRPLYKDKKMFLFILIVALLTMLIAQAMKEDQEQEEEDKIESGE